MSMIGVKDLSKKFADTTANLLIMAAVLAALDVVIFYLVRATFRRDQILTK